MLNEWTRLVVSGCLVLGSLLFVACLDIDLVLLNTGLKYSCSVVIIILYILHLVDCKDTSTFFGVADNIQNYFNLIEQFSCFLYFVC